MLEIGTYRLYRYLKERKHKNSIDNLLQNIATRSIKNGNIIYYSYFTFTKKQFGVIFCLDIFMIHSVNDLRKKAHMASTICLVTKKIDYFKKIKHKICVWDKLMTYTNNKCYFFKLLLYSIFFFAGTMLGILFLLFGIFCFVIDKKINNIVWLFFI